MSPSQPPKAEDGIFKYLMSEQKFKTQRFSVYYEILLYMKMTEKDL